MLGSLGGHARYHRLTQACIKGESLSTKASRARNSLKVVFSKSHYHNVLNRLREWGIDFKNIIKQIIGVRKGCECRRQDNASSLLPVPKYREMQKVTTALFSDLSASMTCEEGEHYGHQASLCINEQIDGNYCFDLSLTSSSEVDGIRKRYDTSW